MTERKGGDKQRRKKEVLVRTELFDKVSLKEGKGDPAVSSDTVRTMKAADFPPSSLASKLETNNKPKYCGNLQVSSLSRPHLKQLKMGTEFLTYKMPAENQEKHPVEQQMAFWPLISIRQHSLIWPAQKGHLESGRRHGCLLPFQPPVLHLQRQPPALKNISPRGCNVGLHWKVRASPTASSGHEFLEVNSFIIDVYPDLMRCLNL